MKLTKRLPFELWCCSKAVVTIALTDLLSSSENDIFRVERRPGVILWGVKTTVGRSSGVALASLLQKSSLFLDRNKTRRLSCLTPQICGHNAKYLPGSRAKTYTLLPAEEQSVGVVVEDF